MLGVGNGGMLASSGRSVVWSDDPLATVQQADDYAAAREWSDWAALSEAKKTTAILDASTFIKVSYSPGRLLTDRETALVVSATVEAARLSLTAPLIGGVEEPQVLKEGMKGFTTEYAEVRPGSASIARLALVSALLRSAGLSGGSTVNVPLRKA